MICKLCDEMLNSMECSKISSFSSYMSKGIENTKKT